MEWPFSSLLWLHLLLDLTNDDSTLQSFHFTLAGVGEMTSDILQWFILVYTITDIIIIVSIAHKNTYKLKASSRQIN